MRPLFSTSGVWLILSLIFICQIAESAGFLRSSSHNRTNIFSRRARDAASPIPINCKLKSWTSWTPCTTCTEETVRFQYVERHSQFGGETCVHSQWDKKACPDHGTCDPQDECGDMHACPETGRCIGQHLLCNGDLDCQLGSDEDDCEEIQSPETKCAGMLYIPGAEKATQGYNSLADVFVNPVLDHKYFGGICEYIYNGEWREMTYDSFCEQLYNNDDEKYFRKPYNFLSYRTMAHSLSQGSTESYSDAASLLRAKKTESSYNWGFTIGVNFFESGPSHSHAESLLNNLTQYDSKDVEFIRLLSTVETAQFRMRSRGLMLHEDMLQSLMELPEQYDFGAYSRFINDFGTHYITQGMMGGILDYVVVLDKKVMEKMELTGTEVKDCIGVGLGLSHTFSMGLAGKISVNVKTCEAVKNLDKDTKSNSGLIKDVVGFVKGGNLGQSAAQLVVRSAETYRSWGKALKHNPAVIKYEGLPIYELVRFSTAEPQARTRIPLLKQAWEEYMQQFNPCRCAPCRNNGVPVLSRTSCRCLCKQGYDGPACEKSAREPGPVHGSWSCWGSWSSCSSGTKTRKRECNNPAPQNGGFQCGGNTVQTKRC